MGGGIDLSYVVEIPMKYIIIPLKLIEIKNLKSYQQKHPTIILSSNVLILTFIRQLFFFKIFLWSIQKYLSNHYLDSGNQTMLTLEKKMIWFDIIISFELWTYVHTN